MKTPYALMTPMQKLQHIAGLLDAFIDAPGGYICPAVDEEVRALRRHVADVVTLQHRFSEDPGEEYPELARAERRADEAYAMAVGK